MRILCVKFFLPSGEYRNFTTANVLQDYHAVVVDPANLVALYGEDLLRYIYSNSIIDSDAAAFIEATSKKRSKEIEGLLELGGVVVCFMRPLTSWWYERKWHERKTKEWVTNYDWLGSDLLSELSNWEAGNGDTVGLCDQNHTFAPYLKQKPSWTAFVRHDKDYSHWKVLAKAYGTHDLALSRRQGRGHIVLLPSGRFDGDAALLESCIKSLLGEKEPREKPIWVREIIVPQQKEIQQKIQDAEDKIDTLRKEKDELSASDEQLERWKWLLWETGRDHLEQVIREALTLIGCQVEPQPVEESDGKVVSEFGTAILEVEGTVDTVTRSFPRNPKTDMEREHKEGYLPQFLLVE
jgi:hypothetical protein